MPANGSQNFHKFWQLVKNKNEIQKRKKKKIGMKNDLLLLKAIFLSV